MLINTSVYVADVVPKAELDTEMLSHSIPVRIRHPASEMCSGHEYRFGHGVDESRHRICKLSIDVTTIDACL